MNQYKKENLKYCKTIDQVEMMENQYALHHHHAEAKQTLKAKILKNKKNYFSVIAQLAGLVEDWGNNCRHP